MICQRLATLLFATLLPVQVFLFLFSFFKPLVCSGQHWLAGFLWTPGPGAFHPQQVGTHLCRQDQLWSLWAEAAQHLPPHWQLQTGGADGGVCGGREEGGGGWDAGRQDLPAGERALGRAGLSAEKEKQRTLAPTQRLQVRDFPQECQADADGSGAWETTGLLGEGEGRQGRLIQMLSPGRAHSSHSCHIILSLFSLFLLSFLLSLLSYYISRNPENTLATDYQQKPLLTSSQSACSLFNPNLSSVVRFKYQDYIDFNMSSGVKKDCLY